MKTKFYKRLVPLALIASMAVTNVGITSASANTPVAIEQTTGMDAPVVGALEKPNAGTTFADYIVTTYGLTYEANYTLTDAKPTLAEQNSADVKIQLKVKDNDNYYKLTNAQLTSGNENYVKIVDSNGDLIDGIEVASFEDSSDNPMTAASCNYVNITVAPTVVANGNVTCKILVAKKTPATGIGSSDSYDWVEVANTFTLKKKIIDERTNQGGTTQQDTVVAAGDAFQIPGGLASKGTTVNAYTVGVAKIKASGADSAKNEVNLAEITDDTALGTWDGTVATKPAIKAENLTPSGKDVYVLYYTPNGSTAKQFVRILTDGEAAKIPYGYYRSKAVLGEKKPSELLTDEEKTTVETNTKTALDALWDAKADAWTAAYNGTDKTEATKDYEIDIPAITGVAADKVLSNNDKIVDLLIAAYDTSKKVTESANQTKAFKEQYVVAADATADPPVAAHNLDGSEKALWDNKTSKPTTDGYAALLEILKNDPKTFMKAEGVTEVASKLYDEFYEVEAAKVINAANKVVYEKGQDVSMLQWTMETLSGDKGTDAKGKEVYTKTNGNAKFWGKSITKKYNSKTKAYTTNKGTADAAVARVEGATASITATKAAKKFNNTVYLKAVTDAYVTPTAKTEAQAANVIFTEQFFVTPALPTAFNPNKLEGVGKDDTAKLSKADGWEDSDSKRNYTLTLDVGKSLKLPFALKDGVEKDLVYEVGEDSNGFNVVNGKVTATDAGSGTIKVYSRALGSGKLYADVNVTVNPAVKSVVANTKSISVWPGSSQVVTLGTNPASNPGSVNTETNTFTPGDFKYKITAPAGVTVKYKKWQIVDTGDTGTAEDDVYGWGDAALESGGFALSDMIVVEPAAEGTIEKNSVIKVELYKGDAKVSFKKDFEIKVNATTAPQDVKSIKATVKAKKDAEGLKHISIPVGGSVNLGCAVTPATANATIDSESNDTDVATVCGDVVTGVGAGFTTVTLTPQGKIADGFKSNITNDENKVEYIIDVYEPGDSILFDDESDLTIKGGFLMTKAAAATDCNKSFPAGVAIDMPFTNEHGEEITWKCNNPAAIGIDTDQGKFIPSIPGTYTITGTTPYTKQKLAFKINVVAENKADDITDAVKNAANVDVVGSPVVGQKMNAFMSVLNTTTGGIGGTVEFESSKPEVATISKKNGAIVCKSAGTTKITAKMTCGSTTITAETDLVVNSKNVTIKTNKVAAGAIKDEDFAVAVAFNNFDKKTMKLVWTAKDSNDADATSKLSGLSEDKLSGKAKFNAVGTYTISVAVKSGEVTVMPATEVGTVNVYENAVKAANVNNADADTKKAIAALGGKNDPAKENTKFNGAGNKQTYYVPVFVTPKADDKPVPAATADDVTFNISNKSLASAEFIPQSGITEAVKTELKTNQENDIVKDYEKAYGLIKIVTAPDAELYKISGVVTVKAILKNSNKTVSVKLNVLNKSLTAQMAYAPQSVTELATDTGVNLAAVVDAGATDAKPMYDNTEKVKAIANSKTKDNATFKVWKYVLVNDSNVKNVNKAQATKMIDTATVTVGSANEATGLSNVKFTFPQGVTAPTDGTWYLALAESTIKVTKKAVKADANATPKVDAADAEYSQSAITVKKIASKTPITKIAAVTTGDDTSGDDDNTNTGNNNG